MNNENNNINNEQIENLYDDELKKIEIEEEEDVDGIPTSKIAFYSFVNRISGTGSLLLAGILVFGYFLSGLSNSNPFDKLTSFLFVGGLMLLSIIVYFSTLKYRREYFKRLSKDKRFQALKIIDILIKLFTGFRR